ncbi:1-acylglycerol-3-phosphate O-acyltransferase [Nocardioides sp. B-3]|nr:1-acylglycerol-3-phosphate O-acyltransferase [Nocardioides sp. B-3]UUZ60065.1 1-acylglycerol-3-phosphate O-acyltransferase [Nocardioides sp. B-3]
MSEPLRTGVRSVLGTAAAAGGLNAGPVAGAVLGAVRRDKRAGTNVGIPLACDSALALAGVKLNITGEENARKARPAIFIGNHRSSLDPVIMGALLRRDFTGVAKAEARFDPRMLAGSLFLDPVFIDRSNSGQSQGALDKLTERIRSGTSIMIFPEGTRMPTPEPGPFKKGAFHMAMQAGVPIVPVVIRNAGELLAPRATVVRQGTVDVCVLDPIDTSDWTVDNLNTIVADVRQLFVDTPGEVAVVTEQMWDLAASPGRRGPDERGRGADVALGEPPAAVVDDLLADDLRRPARLGPLPGRARVGHRAGAALPAAGDGPVAAGRSAGVGARRDVPARLPRTADAPARRRIDGAAPGARADAGARTLRPHPAALGGHSHRGGSRAGGRPTC